MTVENFIEWEINAEMPHPKSNNMTCNKDDVKEFLYKLTFNEQGGRWEGSRHFSTPSNSLVSLLLFYYLQ